MPSFLAMASGSELVVAGNHDRNNAGGLILGYGLGSFGAGRVDEAGETDAGQVCFEGGRVYSFGHRGQQLSGVGQHAEDLRGLRVGAFFEVGQLAFLVGGELRKQHAGRPFSEHEYAVLGLGKGRHAPALGIEGQFGQARKLGFERGARIVFSGGVAGHGYLGRVAQPVAVGALGGVGVEGHSGQQRVAVAQRGQAKRRVGVCFLRGHLVEGQGTRFIRADVGDGAERFHGRQLTHQVMVFGQPLGPSPSAMFTTAGNPSGMAATASEMDTSSKSPRGSPRHQPVAKNHRANSYRPRRQLLAEGAQPLLQRHRGDGQLEEAGDFAQLGVHAGGYHVGRAAAIGHEGALIAQVQAVAEGIGAGGQRGGVFLHVGRLAGQ